MGSLNSRISVEAKLASASKTTSRVLDALTVSFPVFLPVQITLMGRVSGLSPGELASEFPPTVDGLGTLSGNPVKHAGPPRLWYSVGLLIEKNS